MTSFRSIVRPAAFVLAPLFLLASLAVSFGPLRVGASSHREAPLIADDPTADATDFFMYISPDAPDDVTLIANYIPFEAPEGGPNFSQFSSNVRYAIKIDTTGDGSANVTYQFDFSELPRQDGESPTFLYNTGPITSLDDTDWQRRQVYTVSEIVDYGTPVTTVLKSDIPSPPVNIGSKSTPNYTALVDEALAAGVITEGGDTINVFAGQRDDPFWIDLAAVFDLLSLRGQAPPIGYASGNVPIDNLSGFNVHTMAIQVPISRILADAPAGETVIGGWTTASRQTMRTLNNIGDVLTGGATGLNETEGDYVQVSRLGMPLTNEVVIPVQLKDAFNNLDPSQDAGIYTATDPVVGPVGDLLQKSVENPELGRLLCGLYGVPMPKDPDADCNTDFDPDVPASGRADIFKIFLTGMTLTKPFTIQTADGPVELPAGTVVNQPTKGTDGAGAGIAPAEMLRLNTALKGDLCAPTPSRLGVLGGDACGFPNGRRPIDDVTEIELLAVAGAAYSVITDDTFAFNADLIGVLSDNVDKNDLPFLGTFPYLATPHQGQDHIHQNINRIRLPLVFNNTQAVTGRAQAR